MQGFCQRVQSAAYSDSDSDGNEPRVGNERSLAIQGQAPKLVPDRHVVDIPFAWRTTGERLVFCPYCLICLIRFSCTVLWPSIAI